MRYTPISGSCLQKMHACKISAYDKYAYNVYIDEVYLMVRHRDNSSIYLRGVYFTSVHLITGMYFTGMHHKSLACVTCTR
jgi:hypothetical protein